MLSSEKLTTNKSALTSLEKIIIILLSTLLMFAMGLIATQYFERKQVEAQATYVGYHHGGRGTSGGYAVFSTGQSGVPNDAALPGIGNNTSGMNTFINTIYNRLYGGYYQDRIGSAFVINTMLGATRPGNFTGVGEGISYARGNFSRWEALVRAYHQAGLVNWNINQNYPGGSLNSRFMNSTPQPTQPGYPNNDDQFYITLNPEYSMPSIVFYSPSNPAQAIYKIKKNCGNPLGVAQPLPDIKQWEYVPSVGGSPNTSTPINVGDTITINGNVQNVGNEKGLNYTLRLRVVTWTTPGSVTVTNTGGGALQSNESAVDFVNQPGLNAGASGSQRAIQFVVNSNAKNGDQICFGTRVQPWRGKGSTITSSGWRDSSTRCYTISVQAGWQYNARTLSSESSPNAVPIEAGDVISIFADVINNGNGSGWPSYTIQIYPSSNADLVSTQSLSSGGSWDASKRAGWSETGALAAGADSADRWASYRISGDTPDGTTICFNTRVSPSAGQSLPSLTITNSGWTSGIQLCYSVITPERPYLEVRGADVWAGGVFADQANWMGGAACSTGTAAGGDKIIRAKSRNSPARGSTAEYGVFATGDIFEFGSFGVVNATSLTFANTTSPVGNFTNDGRCLTNFYGLFADEPATQTINSNYLAGDGQFKHSGSITLSGGTISSGQQLLLLVDGDIYITGDISYNNYSVNQKSAVPFLMLVATGDINIDSNVSRLDGLYIAHGTTNTCSDAPADITIGSNCDERLAINGAFVAGSIDFDRAHGGLQRGGAAELFRLFPELYLGAPNFSSDFLSDFPAEQFKDLPPVY